MLVVSCCPCESLPPILILATKNTLTPKLYICGEVSYDVPIKQEKDGMIVMELMEAINNRRSVRNYTNVKVANNLIEDLLQAAVQAPSAMNAQPWAYAVIQDDVLLKEYSTRTKQYLLDLLDKTPLLNRYKAMFENPDFNIFYNARSLIIILANVEEGFHHNAEDCCLAAQNLMLTAHSLGLGTCWVGFARAFLNLPDVQKELDIPSNYEVVAPIIVGYPQVNPPAIPKKDPVILFWR